MPRLGRRGMFFRAVPFRAVPCRFVSYRAMPYHVMAGGVVAHCVFSCRVAQSAACVAAQAPCGERPVFAQTVRVPDGKRAGKCGARGSLRGVRVLCGGSDCAGLSGGCGCCTEKSRVSCGPGGAVCGAALHGMAGPAGGEWFRTGRAEGRRLRMSVIFIIFAAVCRREVYGGGVS